MSAFLDIIQGDALQELPKLPAHSVDLIIADPPYNLGKDYGNNVDRKAFDEYVAFSSAWLTQAHRVLRPHGTLYVFMGVRCISYIYAILEQQLGMSFNSWITWHYTQGIGKTKGFSPRHDDILMFTKSEDFTFNLDDVRIPQKYYRARNNMRGANPGDVWEFSHVHYCHENRQDHPTQKPEGLIERMVLASSNEGGVVLDPFFGSGTTLRVCQQLHRRCIGIELNPDYVARTQERLQKPFTGFDSVDPKMERVPKDLNEPRMRDEYFKNHIEWFLKRHNGSVDKFHESIQEMYGTEECKPTARSHTQLSFLTSA